MSRFNLATILTFNNEYYEATFQIKEALKIAPKDTFYEGSAFLLMSDVYNRANKIKEAEHYLNKAIEKLANSKEVSPEVQAAILDKKSQLLGAKGETDKVIKNLLIAISIIQQQPNMKPRNTKEGYDSFVYLTEIYRKLAGVYFINKEYSQAFEFVNKSLERTVTISGENSRLASRDQHTIGNIYYMTGNYKKSIQYLYTALKGYKIHLKNDHILFPLIKTDVGKCLRMLGKNEEAVIFYKEALISFLKVKSKTVDQVIEIAELQTTIGNLFIGEKEFQEAIDYYNSSISTFEKINRQGHEMYEIAKNNLKAAKRSLH